MAVILRLEGGLDLRILYDPAPRQTDEIFDPGARAAFFAHDVIEVDPAARDYTRDLPGVEILVSQQAMDRTRLDLAPDLRAIFNVETNFLPNIDYEACFERGIHVLTPAAVFDLPVAEMGLGMGLSLMRDIHSGHMAFARGAERTLGERGRVGRAHEDRHIPYCPSRNHPAE